MCRVLIKFSFAGANRVRSSSNAAIDHFEIHQGTHILQVSLFSRHAANDKSDNAFNELSILKILIPCF